VDSTAPQVFAGFAASYSSKILELKTEIESLTIPMVGSSLHSLPTSIHATAITFRSTLALSQQQRTDFTVSKIFRDQILYLMELDQRVSFSIGIIIFYIVKSYQVAYSKNLSLYRYT
jgi:hypothetical protein